MIPVQADTRNERNAIINHGFRWMSWIDIPIKGTPDYPKEQRVRQLMSPEQLNSDRWKTFWDKLEKREADGTEPLSYAYCSSGGSVAIYPVATKEELKSLKTSTNVEVIENLDQILKEKKEEHLLDALENNLWGLTPQDDGEDCIYWNVFEYHMTEPCERIIGTGNTPEEAILDAMSENEYST